MKQFASPAIDNVPFEVNGEIFHARPSAPAALMIRLMKVAGDQVDVAAAASPERRGEVMSQMDDAMEFLQAVLTEESWERFSERLEGRGGVPIGFLLLVEDIFPWLVEVMTNRPTELPSGSPAGQSETGTTSMESAPSEASTPPLSPAAAS